MVVIECLIINMFRKSCPQLFLFSRLLTISVTSYLLTGVKNKEFLLGLVKVSVKLREVFVCWILLARSGPIFVKYELKQSAISSGLEVKCPSEIIVLIVFEDLFLFKIELICFQVF